MFSTDRVRFLRISTNPAFAVSVTYWKRKKPANTGSIPVSATISPMESIGSNMRRHASITPFLNSRTTQIKSVCYRRRKYHTFWRRLRQSSGAGLRRRNMRSRHNPWLVRGPEDQPDSHSARKTDAEPQNGHIESFNGRLRDKCERQLVSQPG